MPPYNGNGQFDDGECEDVILDEGACLLDSDGDGIPNAQDLCPQAADPTNEEGPDGLGVACIVMIDD